MTRSDDVERTPPMSPALSASDHDLLVRIHERQRSENERLDQLHTMNVQINARLDTLDEKYVSRAEFWPVRALVYGFAGVIFLAVVGALVALVVLNRNMQAAGRGEPGPQSVLAGRSLP